MRNITFFVLLTNRPARSVMTKKTIIFLLFGCSCGCLASPRLATVTVQAEKIHKFEQFVDGHLKPQLVRTRFLSNKRFSQICE
uniref:Uncharacterized protein n=1 Tax=Salix viminalis TaxID=40686 RepID=A0A6N2M2G2_SALVM